MHLSRVYFSQSSHRAILLSILLSVLLFTTRVFCETVRGFNDLEGDYVFVPGLYGVEIYDNEANELIWLPESTLMHPSRTRRMDLALNIKGNEPDGMTPKGVLKNLGPIAVYGKFSSNMRSLQKSKRQFRYHEFVYDWRRTNEVSAKLLVAYLQNIYNNNGHKPINVIAHSNGGLVTLLALHAKPRLFAGCVFVGTPFQGSADTYSQLKFGVKLDANGPLLVDPASIFTTRPFFSFIPPRSVFVDKSNQTINIDPMNPKVWRQSTFTDVLDVDSTRNLVLGTRKQRLKYLDYILRVSHRMYEKLKFRGSDFKYPPLVVLASDNLLTITGFPLSKNSDGRWEISYDEPIMGKGDSDVPFDSAVPAKGIPHILVRGKASHLKQFENLDEISAALAKLHELQHN